MALAPSLYQRRRRRGSNAVEFALCFPVWFAIVVAIMDFAWVFYQGTALDAATNRGCRAGSLVDPGDGDTNIAEVNAVATTRMRDVLIASSLQVDTCDDCLVSTHTSGAPPNRSLVCEATRDISPLVGLFFGTQQITSTQVSRLEWQREAAPG